MPSSILNSDDGVISGTAGLKNSGGDDAVLLIQTKGVTAATVSASQVFDFVNPPTGIPSASPGGSDTQVQFNNAGAFGGISGVTTDGTRMTASTTIGVGGATPSTSGSGITFPATASASTNANTLDDYEEGTWTPILADASTGGNVASSYAVQDGFYTKIGQLVVVTVIFTFPVTTGMTGANEAFIRGLPFAPSVNANRGESVGAIFVRTITLSAGQTYFVARTVVNTTNMQIMQCGSNINESTTIISQFVSGGSFLRLTLAYNTV